MKKATFLLLFSGLLAAQADFVYRSGTSFLTTADLDGNGRADLVLVDGSNATVRVGYQLSAANLTWAAARPLGLDEVSDINCGAIQAPAYDSIVATAPALNRLNVYRAQTASAHLSPVAVYMNGTGPYSVAALDIGGSGNDIHDDLTVITALNGSSPYRLERIRSNGSSFYSMGQTAVGSAWRHLNALEYAFNIEGLAVIDALSGGFLRIYDLASGSLIHKASVSTSGMIQPSYVSFLRSSGAAHFVLWEKGSSSIRTTTLNGGGGSYSFSSPLAYALSAPVDSMYMVQGAGTSRLAVIYTDGSAEIFDHDGSGAPVSLQTLLPPTGEKFAGFLPLDANDFMAISSESGDLSGPVTADQQHFSGGSFSSVGTVVLPAAPAGNGAANVMTFVGEPLVNSSPQRLQLLRAGDWSTIVALGASVTVQYETDNGWEQGLGNQQISSIAAVAPGAAYTLDNQLHDAISIHSFDAARGEEVVVVQITPDPGTYGALVEVALSAPPAATLYYRTDPSNAWNIYSAPLSLFADTDVHYYARSGSKGSIIRTAAYRFSEAPSDLDSDGDGIPDYVELANELDPINSGMDSDGDGFSDLDELLAGSSPVDSGDIPASSNRIERAAVYDQILVPRPYDGVYNETTTSRVGTQVRLFSASGAQYGYAQTTNFLPGLTLLRPVLFEAVPMSLEPPFVSAVTDVNFETYRDPVYKHHGIELLGLYLQPTSGVTRVDYTYQGGGLASEANGWLSAALDVYTNQVRTVQLADLSLTNTVAAMLIERKIADLLLDRDTITNDWVSLFKGRPADGTMEGLSSSDIQSLENQGPSNEVAYLIRSLVSSIHEDVPLQVELLELAQDLYDIRSYFGRFSANAGKYPLPVDELRSFLYTGVIHSNYLAHAAISPTEVSLAYAEAVQTMTQVTARPTENLMLEVRADSFDAACPVLYTGGNAAKSLYTAKGNAFRFPVTFTLQPGAQVSVEAFTDPNWNLCPGTDPLEVISLALTAVPTASGTDADGNLLPDDYEEMFLVGSGGLATSDLDGDGFSDLQEYLENTDPTDISNYPGVGAVDFSAPIVQISTPVAGQAQLDIGWPAAYADDFIFTVMQSTNLTDTAFAADVELAPGSLSESMNTTIDTAAFYQVQMKLR